MRTVHPSEDQKRGRRRPKSRGDTRPDDIRAKSTALPMRQRSWTTVAMMLTAGGGSSKSAPAATAATPMKIAAARVAPNAAISATIEVHGFQRRVPEGVTPSGTSGSSGSGAGWA